MKALSVQEPYLDYILRCGKRIENRRQRTHHRGELILHASRRVSHIGMAVRYHDDDQRYLQTLGMLRGECRLVDCLRPPEALERFPDQEYWIYDHEDSWCWVLEDVEPLPFPQPARGRLGLWNVDEQLLEMARGHML